MNPFPAVRALAFRSRPAALPIRSAGAAGVGARRAVLGRRSFADKKASILPEAQQGEVGPNMEQQEHVSEEAAKTQKIMGGEGPDIEGHGTPVQDVGRAARACHRGGMRADCLWRPRSLRMTKMHGDTRPPC